MKQSIHQRKAHCSDIVVTVILRLIGRKYNLVNQFKANEKYFIDPAHGVEFDDTGSIYRWPT